MRPRQEFRNKLIAWSMSEMLAKLSRILVVIAVARVLDVAEIGLAAAALAVSDIVKSLTQNGIGQVVIAAPAEDLEARCRTARWLFGLWSALLCAGQLGIALGCWLLGGNPELAAFIALLGSEYLLMVPGLVPAALAMRDDRVRAMAAIAGGQVVLSNLLSVLICLIWPTALALVLPRLLTVPLWVGAVRRLRPWRTRTDVPAAPVDPFLRYGTAILGISLLESLRLQADRLIVGLLLGTEAVGMYFMAFNAGLSLSNSVSVAFAKVLFPHLCAQEDRDTALRHSLAMSLAVIGPVVLLQAALAPLYVPLLLGAHWAGISPVVSVLCLVAIPSMIWTAAASWLRVNNRPQRELAVTACLAAGMIVNTIVMAPLGLMAIATGYLGIVGLIMIIASLPVLFATRKSAHARI